MLVNCLSPSLLFVEWTVFMLLFVCRNEIFFQFAGLFVPTTSSCVSMASSVYRAAGCAIAQMIAPMAPTSRNAKVSRVASFARTEATDSILFDRLTLTWLDSVASEGFTKDLRSVANWIFFVWLERADASLINSSFLLELAKKLDTDSWKCQRLNKYLINSFCEHFAYFRFGLVEPTNYEQRARISRWHKRLLCCHYHSFSPRP